MTENTEKKSSETQGEDSPSTRLVAGPGPTRDNGQPATRRECEDDLQILPPGCLPTPGQCVEDYRLLEVLGSGSFATVYLALQVSLGRQVALKILTTQDNEARTLASLEHPHIVHVFSETVDQARGLRLLSMQFVPGTTLEQVRKSLSTQATPARSGQLLIDTLDSHCRHPAMLDLAALRDRESIAQSSFEEAICWLGARLAEALAHAHSRGVLHRDIKPANILLNRYGRPFLSDFNLAGSTQGNQGGGNFGGTLHYMAPEHLQAFNPYSRVTHEAVNELSDVYSLGAVLYELFSGKSFLPTLPHSDSPIEMVEKLTELRQTSVPSIRVDRPEVPVVIDRVIRRCLAPDPTQRFSSAQELAQALDGAGELTRMQREFPPPLALTRYCEKHPIRMMTLLAVLPHLVGSLVNIAYNSLAIVVELTPGQKASFTHTLIGYNVLVYPILIWVWCRAVLPVMRMLKTIEAGEAVEDAQVTRMRRQSLRLPGLLMTLSFLGWFPGGVVFPLSISIFSTLLSWHVFWEFLLSFSLSGLIATTYAYFCIQFLAIRIIYPRLWEDARHPKMHTRRELKSLYGRLCLFQLLAGAIPLAGAILLVSTGTEDHFTLGFRLLIVGLIILGMMGINLAILASGRLTQTLQVLLGHRSDLAAG